MKKVAVIMGSDSDWPVVKAACQQLAAFSIPYEAHILSAHRTPAAAAEFASNARKNGFGVLICAAGMAAHLAGAFAGNSTLPVIGIPMKGGAADGLDAAAIAQRLDAVKDRIRIYGRIDTLEYLRKGGRIGAASATVGTMLNIKPIISVQDGVVQNVGKARGAKMADKQLRELIAKSGGIDFSKPMCAAYSGLEDDNLQNFLAESTELLCGSEAPIATVGCVIGAHVGPGAVALAFFHN